MPAPRHRRLIVLRGGAAETRDAALARLAGLAADDVLWVADEPAPGVTHVRPADVRRLLGGSFVAVVLDLHAGLDADRLGQCHGFVWGGGALVLRMPPPDAAAPRDPSLAVAPYDVEAVGHRLWDRLEARVASAPDDGAPLTRPEAVSGTAEQALVVERLAARLAAPEPSCAVLLSDRGRGKSSAMGLAVAAARALDPGLRVAVTAGSEASANEVLRFAPDDVRFLPVEALCTPEEPLDAILVDEAAQLPVPTLQRLVRSHPRARLAFASTVRGYEGTGRGFVLRFLAWLGREPRPVERLQLEAPIRWDAGDPLERFVFDALLLDAAPDPAPGGGARTAASLDRDALAADEGLLRAIFGLLVHAHYRTTPSDLARLLDAPNLRVHALRDAGAVVGATLLALEGSLDAQTIADVHQGRVRIRGHALPDTLISHCGRPDAGALRWVRSVRIATHPERRREGLATELVDHVHASHAPDGFGTLFGATADLLRFRRSVGYALVRVGASRGARTGEPAAVMLRPVSALARALVDELRGALARDLPLQLELMHDELPLDAELRDALFDDLPAPTPLTVAAQREAVTAYAFGPRPFEASAYAITAWVDDHAARLGELDATGRALVEARIRDRRPWREATARAGLPSVPAAMRALRRAVQALAARVDPGSWPRVGS
ncbi:MAG: tRNA(Met) cytidine acetyltransferase [Sandaracinaceae bacterium]|nr:tRNA(Met) cytidine acetyltransferase [Sandaracinaceae bacterium]